MSKRPAFRHFVSVYRKSDAQDSDGQPYAPVCLRKDVSCNIVTVGGSEVEQAHQNVPVNRYGVELFQSSAKPITPDCWLDWKGRKLNIEHVPANVNDNLPVELLCVEDG